MARNNFGPSWLQGASIEKPLFPLKLLKRLVAAVQLVFAFLLPYLFVYLKTKHNTKQKLFLHGIQQLTRRVAFDAVMLFEQAW